MRDEFVTILIIGIVLIFILWLYVILPAKMAKKRGRSAIRWIIFFLITSPISGIITLLILGDSKEKIKKDVLEELQREHK